MLSSLPRGTDTGLSRPHRGILSLNIVHDAGRANRVAAEAYRETQRPLPGARNDTSSRQVRLGGARARRNRLLLGYSDPAMAKSEARTDVTMVDATARTLRFQPPLFLVGLTLVLAGLALYFLAIAVSIGRLAFQFGPEARAWNEALRWCHEEKNRDEAIRLLAEAEKIDEKAAANRLRQLPKSGRLNLPGLQSVLDLRVQFKLTPPMGQDLSNYYDESFYRETSK